MRGKRGRQKNIGIIDEFQGCVIEKWDQANRKLFKEERG